MRNGSCPKCNSGEVYHGLVSEGEGLTAGSYTLSVELFAGSNQKTLWVDTYICRTCGYIEMHVVNCDALDALPQADGWELVTPGSRSD